MPGALLSRAVLHENTAHLRRRHCSHPRSVLLPTSREASKGVCATVGCRSSQRKTHCGGCWKGMMNQCTIAADNRHRKGRTARITLLVARGPSSLSCHEADAWHLAESSVDRRTVGRSPIRRQKTALRNSHQKPHGRCWRGCAAVSLQVCEDCLYRDSQ